MPRFRKRSVIVDAIQWTGDNTTDVIDWILGTGIGSARYHDEDKTIAIDTLEGTVRAYHDYWIIRGIAGEHYPCRADIFEATYEPV